jgi:hypothetical protein
MANVTLQPMLDYTVHISCVRGNCTTDDMDNISYDAAYTMRILYGIVGSVGMVGNAVVIGVIMRSEHMCKKTTNILIANQSAIDFLISLFIILCTFIRDVSKVNGIIAKEIFCRMWATNFPIWGLFVSSTYNLVCITMERYVGIVYPMSHNRTCSKGKTRFALVFAWIIGPAYTLTHNIPSSAYRNGSCTVYTEWPSLAVQRAVGLLNVAIEFIIPILIITFAYIHIAVTLHMSIIHKNTSENPAHDNRDNHMKRARLNVIKMLLMVAISFIMCWSPNQVIFAMYNSGIDIDFNGSFYHFTVIMVFLNCCINPFIYAFRFDQFKKELFKQCRKMPNANDMPLSSNMYIVASKVGDRKDMHQQSISANRGGTIEIQQGNNGEFSNICYEEN